MTTDMLIRRHILPSTSTPVGARVQPAVAVNRGATFSGYDSKHRLSARGQNVGDIVGGGCQSSNDSARKLHRDGMAENCPIIRFSPDKQHCSTPAGRGRCVPVTTASFLMRRELTNDASFCDKSRCSTRVSRHASINSSSLACFDDRLRKPEKLSGSFLSGGGLGFLRKLSRGSDRTASPNHCGSANVSTASVRRRSSLRDSFKRLFLNRRFGCNIVDEMLCSLMCNYCQHLN